MRESGFTLIELLVVIGIIGLLANIAIPAYQDFQKKSKIAVTATEMRSISTAFNAYLTDNDDFPPDSHRTLPPGMDAYLPASLWANNTPIGGYYNWEGPDNYPYAGLSIFNSSESLSTFETLDRMLDNGDILTGQFRIGSGGRPTLIIQD